MTQKEVAEFLGIAPRTVQRYAQQGKLACTYEPGPQGGHRPVYAQADVEKFRERMGAAGNGNDNVGASPGLAVRRPGGASIDQLLEVLTRLPAPAQIRATEKFTLTLPEASELSGLSKGFLREAIAKKKLKGIRGAGRGFRIRRQDLETFVRGLV